MKTAIFLQARLNSKRFPKKIFMKIKNKTIIEIIIERLTDKKKEIEFFVLTSHAKSDKTLRDFLIRKKIKFFSGSENDVLSRFYYAAKKNEIDIIIRCNGDCPFLNLRLIKKMYKSFKKKKIDYMSNILVPCFPSGMHVEIFNFKALKYAFEKSKGEIICLMDADDLFSLNKLKIVNNFFITNKKKNILFNLPKLPSGIFKYKKKSYFNSVWPTIFPTSCISIRRKSFRQFFNYSCLKKFPNLEIDARMIIYYYFLLNEYNVLNKILTTYTYDEKGITAKIKKFDKNWWMRRKQAFDYTKFVLNKKNKKFFFNLDFFVTTIIYKVLRCIK